jgi:cytochrome c biogenesis protein CcmG, thiol:disulfide interchange protein DsbE
MKISLILLCLCLLITAAYTVYSEQHFFKPNTSAPILTQTTPAQLSRHYAAPNFSFETLKGKKGALNDFQGKVVLLNFWASWCAPCVIEFPQMVDLAAANPDIMVLLFVSIDEDRTAIDRFLKTYGKNLSGKDNIHIIHDSRKAISQTLYNTFKIPETYIIDRNGMIVEKIIGADIVWNDDTMKEKISKLYKAE